jgi:hypothetical protein
MFGKRSSGLPKCLCCFMSLDGRASWDIGSAVLGSIDEARLNEAVKGERWKDASQFQAANANADIRVWRAFFCGDKALVYPMVSRFEIWEDDDYEEPIIVRAGQALRALKQLEGGSDP